MIIYTQRLAAERNLSLSVHMSDEVANDKSFQIEGEIPGKNTVCTVLILCI